MEGRCRKSSCHCRHPPVCRNYTSGNTCIDGNNCVHRHADGEEKPSKTSKSERPQGAVSILEEKVQGCVSKFRFKEVFSAEILAKEIERFEETHQKILMMHLVRNSIRERKQGNLEALTKKVNLMSEILARQSLRKGTPEQTSRQKEYASKAAWHLARNMQAQGRGQSYVDSLVKKAPVLVANNRRTYVCGLTRELQCTCWARRIQAQMTWRLCGAPETLRR